MEYLLAMLELHSQYNFDKHISGILFRVNLLQLDVTLTKNLPNKVQSDVDVLRPCMKNLVLCQIDSIHAITIDLQQ